MKYLHNDGKYTLVECDECGMTLKLKKYQLDKIKEGVECFCGNVSYTIDGLPKSENIISTPMTKPTNVSAAPTPVAPALVQPSGPRCPTCGSTRVKKISMTSKAVGGAMFGIFSSNIRNTFKCESCGYKW